MNHEHTVDHTTERDECWSAPLRRDDDPLRVRGADGCVIRIDCCECGARRKRAINGGFEEAGEWAD
jgi:hypothetical protein